jgi:O-antigen/teichoic acid export membrane protein
MKEEPLSFTIAEDSAEKEFSKRDARGASSSATASVASATVVKNLVWLLLGPVLRLAIAIPLAGFTARSLGLEHYGEFNLALSVVVLLGVLSNLGLNEVLNRTVARQPETAQSLWLSVLAFKAGPLSVYLVILVSIAWLLGYSSSIMAMVLLLGGAQWLMSLENTSRAVFAGCQRMEILGRVEIGKVVIETLLWFTILYLGFGAVALAGGRLVIAALGFVFSTILVVHQFKFRFSRPQWRLAMDLLPSSLRFAQTSAVQSLYDRIGFVLLAAVAGAQAVALVSTATTLTEKIFWFAPSVQSAIFPFFSRLQVTETERVRSAVARALRYQFLVAVGCGLGTSVLGPWVIRLVFPREFWVAGAVIEILGWACVPKLVGNFLVTILQSLGYERRASWISALQCVTFGCGLLALAPWWGVFGFAWALLLAEMVATGVQLTLLQRSGVLSATKIGSLSAIVVSGLALFGAMDWLPGGRDNLLGELALLSSFPLLVILSRGVSHEDVNYLQGLWLNRRPSAV